MRPEYLTITISNLNFNFPPLIVHQQVVLKFRQRVLYPQMPPNGKNTFVLNASTLQYLTVILVSTFQLLYFPRYQGSQIYTRGPYALWTPPSGEICLPKASTSQYLIVFLISTFQLQQFPKFQGVCYDVQYVLISLQD